MNAASGARTAFFGTPAAAVPCLAALSAATRVAVVVTRPDKPRGRSGAPRPPPIKEAAEALGLTVAQPVKAAEAADLLGGVDLAVVVAYGRLLPAEMLAVPVHGFVNVHFSRLPRWRGAAPVARAILAGDTTTGVDVMQLDAGMDTGPIIARRAATIEFTDTTGTLTARLAGMGADLLTETLPGILDGSAVLTPQPPDGITIAAKITPVDARLQPGILEAQTCERIVRACSPNPGAWGMLDGERLKVWQARRHSDADVPAGETRMKEGVPVVGTPTGGLELVEVQAAGKARMPGSVWARGHRGAFRWE